MRVFVALGLVVAAPAVLAQPSLFSQYDLYAYLPGSGATVQVSSIPDRGEFNPSWAPFGPYVVHDVAAFGAGDAFLGQELSVTNAATGASVLLPNTDGGNDADWWPFGLLIAYDRAAIPGAPDETVYLSAAWGGPRIAVRTDAVDPSWSPTGRFLAFRQPSDGSIRALDLFTGAVVLVAPTGQNPAWAPGGRSIAFSDGDDLFRVPVHLNGTPTGPPVAVTSGPERDSQPAWAPGGGRLVYQSDATGAIDLWTTPTSGGGGTALTGDPSFGDFDPDVYPGQARAIVYAGYTDAAARVAGGTFDAPHVRVTEVLAAAPAEVSALAAGLALGPAPGDALDAWLTTTVGAQAVADEAETPGAVSLALSPNPTAGEATLRLVLTAPAVVVATIHDVLGREVVRVDAGPLGVGTHAVPLPTAGLPAGAYLVRVLVEGQRLTQRLTILR